MSELLELTKQIARTAHSGQKYGSADYFKGHIVPVVNVVRHLGYGPDYQATAFLHDVEEDAGFTVMQLIEWGVPASIAASAHLLKKEPDISHEVYLTRIGIDKRATVAKFGDSLVNLGNTALMTTRSSDEKFRERISEYSGNIAFLAPILPKPELCN